MNRLEQSVNTDMLVQASGKGQAAFIGRVVGLKRHRFVKLSQQDMPGGQRRYIPLAWVKSVKGNIVHLDQTTASVRGGWLNKAEMKAELKAQVKAEPNSEKPSG